MIPFGKTKNFTLYKKLYITKIGNRIVLPKTQKTFYRSLQKAPCSALKKNRLVTQKICKKVFENRLEKQKTLRYTKNFTLQKFVTE